MQKLLSVDTGQTPTRVDVPPDLSFASASLIQVLWRRRRSVVIPVGACLFFTAVYLVAATPVYRATARLHVKQDGPRILGTGQAPEQSEHYLQTQVDVLRSTPVLSRALEAVGYQDMRMFAGAEGNIAAQLQRSAALDIEALKRSEVIELSIESPWPEEAAALIESIITVYLDEAARRTRATGQEMVKVLEREKQELRRKRTALVQTMLVHKQSTGVMSFGNDAGNTFLERIASLSSALTAVQVQAMELRAELASIRSVMADPASASGYVVAQQFRGRELGDHEYDQLRTQLTEHVLAHSSAIEMLGPSHPRLHSLQAVVDSLKQRIAVKEQAIVQAQLVAVAAQLAGAEEKQRELTASLETERRSATAVSAEAAEYAQAAVDVDRMQKQSDLLDARIAEIVVNDIEGAPLNVQVLDPASASRNPVRPQKSLALLAALLCGGMIGMGLAVWREWQDARLRTPEEIMTLLGTPVLASVPRSNQRLSAVARGQLLHFDPHSPTAEAYRSVRTTLLLGHHRGARTILMASPTPGDGKSSTASNLAIAFAQSGERTLLIDCDLREPVQHLIFDCETGAGLTSVINGTSKLRAAIQETSVPNLYLLPCGPVPESPAELLASRRFARLLAALGKAFDRIIIDSPPLMSAADGRILGAAADGTLLVLRMNQSMRKFGLMALDGLEKVGANMLGAIANDVPHGAGYDHYYGGSQQYAADRIRLPLHSDASAALLPVPAGASRNGNGARSALPIEEPDWPTEVR